MLGVDLGRVPGDVEVLRGLLKGSCDEEASVYRGGNRLVGHHDGGGGDVLNHFTVPFIGSLSLLDRFGNGLGRAGVGGSTGTTVPNGISPAGHPRSLNRWCLSIAAVPWREVSALG
jgi:hypothetical protein